MTPQLIPITKPADHKPYRPVLSARERRAYSAAHRIAALFGGETVQAGLRYAGHGARRSKTVDEVARVILEEGIG